MIPKLASHILHQTSRAAATAQNYTFRNVLGFQSPSTASGGLGGWSGAGSSSWGSYGAGPGGAKYSSGSRFYSGYQNAGRAVTQANSATSQDPLRSQTDDEEELRSFRPAAVTTQSRTRPRSSSLSLSGTGRSKRADSFGVLKTVQLHQARAKHALARVLPNELDEAPSRPVQVRRNSISATSASDAAESPQIFDKPLPDTFSTDPAAPQTAIPPDNTLTESNGDSEGDWAVYNRLQAARRSGDYATVLAEVKNFRENHPNPTVKEYNLAISALFQSRKTGRSLKDILETYNEMLLRQVIPNLRTYKVMILALTERDAEVHREIERLEANIQMHPMMEKPPGTEQIQLDRLKGENNFEAAMTMFNALQTIVSQKFPLAMRVYNGLLRSCANAGDVDAAIRMFAHLEASGVRPDGGSYIHLMSAYVNARDVKGAEEVFNEFRAASAEGRIVFISESDEDHDTAKRDNDDHLNSARRLQMCMWVKMIEAYFRANQPIKALDVLAQMLDSPAGVEYGPADVPLPSPAVYTAFIYGFMENNDVKSALLWFERMRGNSTAPGHFLDAMAVAPAPDYRTWSMVIQNLAQRGMVAELNPLFHHMVQLQDSKGLNITGPLRLLVATANAAYLRDGASSEEEIDSIVNFLQNEVLVYGPRDVDTSYQATRGLIYNLFKALESRGRVAQGLSFVKGYIDFEHAYMISHDHEEDLHDIDTADTGALHITAVWRVVRRIVHLVVQNQTKLTLQQALEFGALCTRINASPSVGLCALGLEAYYNALDAAGSPAALNFSAETWGLIAVMGCKMVLRDFVDEQHLTEDATLPSSSTFKFRGLTALLAEINSGVPEFRDLPRQAKRRIADSLVRLHGIEEAEKVAMSINPEWFHVIRRLARRPENLNFVPGEMPEVKLDHPLVSVHYSRHVDEYFPANPSVSVETAYKRYDAGARVDKFPTPEAMARLIQTLGRMNDLEKVYRIYNDAQRVLASLDLNKQWQSSGWFAVESAMILALAHSGHVDKAHIHRQRILDQGGRPSHDAYGTLIQYVAETTDDSANALALWNEAISIGVAPNIFMYNTIISKLSKARKADMALDLFQQMKTNGVRPSPVSYGAVIAACCRVGDAQSAELLFDEMVAQKNYRPRVPPYNTMIQFYTHTVRNRERALHYYNALLAAGVKPTAHTYKLLMDCYGTIEPIDIQAMEGVFNRIAKDQSVRVQGVHWAALINAYGCVMKDFDKAMSIFDSIPNHPTTKLSGTKLPDAVTFESLINVLITLRRTDVVPEVLQRLSSSGIHMTAYIANLLIKGYADAGQIERSREIFESLLDPPVGVAAPNNHAPHDVTRQPSVSPHEPVYREPSTWEAMVRAELGSKNRDNAVALLQRLQSRQFPPAVYHRISGIMLDDEVAPWSQPSSLPSSDPSSPTN
ncbi:hypothetical protein SCHPADRAFT_846456 [Schizopora paradoxa]|uniref:Pentacotripeptide-repeat region of PRORP domain-containing protein n=1 Tax=Schizopora paradoxa TaxID=27342 RepID=A0A0H2SKA7_9AGAM|nr:hypothetical protein SCHPADRAFT_846456 [Schizopora paradoxa]